MLLRPHGQREDPGVTHHFDADSADCHVFTYKEGLLSRVAHDLRLIVGKFELAVEVDPWAVRATFDATSLRVDTPMKDGKENPSALSAADRAKIENTIRKEVLRVKHNPEIRFESHAIEAAQGGKWRIRGTLTLAGRRQPLDFEARPRDGRLVATISLNQPDFGIKPYSAMLGTLKIKPQVEVRIAVPAVEDA